MVQGKEMRGEGLEEDNEIFDYGDNVPDDLACILNCVQKAVKIHVYAWIKRTVWGNELLGLIAERCHLKIHNKVLGYSALGKTSIWMMVG